MELSETKHIFHRFDDDINELAALVDNMGEIAVGQLAKAVKALKKEDPAMARKVIRRDRKLNDLDVEIDEKIILLIAKRAPVAGDLRQIMAIGKIVTDLERTGDEARKIAKLCLNFHEAGNNAPDDRILRDIYSLAKFVSGMLKVSMEAFSRLDVELACEVLRLNKELDYQMDAVLRHLTTFILEDSRNVGNFVDIVLGIRALERYGGHAKNVAGHVIFLATSNDVRHLDLEQIRQLLGIKGEITEH